jgi:hypothetical protein
MRSEVQTGCNLEKTRWMKAFGDVMIRAHAASGYTRPAGSRICVGISRQVGRRTTVTRSCACGVRALTIPATTADPIVEDGVVIVRSRSTAHDAGSESEAIAQRRRDCDRRGLPA